MFAFSFPKNSSPNPCVKSNASCYGARFRFRNYSKGRRVRCGTPTMEEGAAWEEKCQST